MSLAEVAVRTQRMSVERPRWLTVPVIIGLVVIVGWVVVATTVPLWTPYGPLDSVGPPLAPPSLQHLLGTDALGRDVLVRTLYGTRESLPLAVSVIAVGVGIGCLVGAAAGFFGGWVDSILMRLVDITLAYPAILLAMVITASIGPGITHIGIAMIVVWWPIYARLLRAQVLAVKQLDHVEAAVAAGASRRRQLFVHILPLSMTPVLVNATMDFGQVVILAAGLSFVGLGAVPPTPEWGISISEGAVHFYQWWIAFGPGISILSIVLAFNFVGDGVRDLLDVRMDRARP
jgi:peptide/nickel transport system permease protein